MNVSFSHTISPSALSGQGRIKELMDALPPDERQKALELLLAAKESHWTVRREKLKFSRLRFIKFQLLKKNVYKNQFLNF